MGREGGGKDGGGDTQRGTGTVVSLEEYKKKKDVEDRHERRGQYMSTQYEDKKGDTDYRLRHGFDRWVPEPGATGPQWKEYFLGIHREVSPVYDRKKAPEYFYEIASCMLLSDLERLLRKSAVYKDKYPELFEAVEKVKKECEEAKKYFKLLCAGGGVDSESAGGASFADLVSDLKNDSENPHFLKRLLASGPEFAKTYPGAYEAITHQSTSKVGALESMGKIVRFVPRTAQGPHLVEGEQSYEKRLKTLTSIESALSQMDHPPFEERPAPVSENVGKILDKRIESLCGRGTEAVLERCRELVSKSQRYIAGENVYEYQEYKKFLSEEAQKLERLLIVEFLSRSPLVQAEVTMQKNMLSDRHKKARLEETVRIRGEFENRKTSELLQTSFLRTLFPGVLFDGRIIVLMEKLRTRLKDLPSLD